MRIAHVLNQGKEPSGEIPMEELTVATNEHTGWYQYVQELLQR